MGLIDSILSIGNAWGQQIQQQNFASQEAEKARNETYSLNEKAADNADARTRALYNDLYSPEARMLAMKEAGISPAMAMTGGAMGGSGSGSGAMGGTNGGQAVSPSTPGTSIEISSDEILKILDAKGKKIENQMKELELKNKEKEFSDKWEKDGITNRIRNNEATLSDAEVTLKNLELGREKYKNEKGYDTLMIDNDYAMNYANAIILSNTAETSKLDTEIRKKLDNQVFDARKAELEKIGYECELTRKQSENFQKEFNLKVRQVEIKAAELRQKQEQFDKGLIQEKELAEAKLAFEKEQNQLDRDINESQFTKKLDLEERKLLVEKIRQRNQAIAGFIESGGKAVGSIVGAVM